MSAGDLLAPDEPPAVAVTFEHGRSPMLLTCDHAGARIPRLLDSLGLASEDLTRHIAWDIGAAGVAEALAARLDATLILQRYSRLVIDCNRAPEWPDSIVKRSDGTVIPGNARPSTAQLGARQAQIFWPYHDRIRAELDARAAQHRSSFLISVHSFTPRMNGFDRPWHVGVLFNRDRRMADHCLPLLRACGLTVGVNEPYSLSDETDYTVPVHGERRRVPSLEIELRQDLIAAEAGQAEWAERLAEVLVEVTRAFEGDRFESI